MEFIWELRCIITSSGMTDTQRLFNMQKSVSSIENVSIQMHTTVP